LLAAVALPARASEAADLFAGYSVLDLDGDWAHGAAAGAAVTRRGGTLRLGLDATAHPGGGGPVRELGLLASFALAARASASVSPFLVLRAGGAARREQVDVFGVKVGPEGVCDGSCPYALGPSAEGGGGLDIRLSGRWHLRLEADYRVRRVSGTVERGLRLSGGLARR
jgi:hypothetical protein